MSRGNRIGERLVRAGEITPVQLEAALRAQVVQGGRLGTNLVEALDLELDAVARALAAQHGIPPALQVDFDLAEVVLQRGLSAELAERWYAIPLRMTEASAGRLLVAVRDPLPDEAVDELTMALGLAIQPAVAAELRIFFYLEEIYSIRRTTRFIRVRPSGSIDLALPSHQFESLEIPIVEAEAEQGEPGPDSDGMETSERLPGDSVSEPPPLEVAEIELAPSRAETPAEAMDIELAPSQVAAPAEAMDIELDAPPEQPTPDRRERRRFVRTLSDVEPDNAPVLARIDIKSRGSGSGGIRGERAEAANLASIPDAVRAIRRATGRDGAGDLIVDAMQQGFDKRFDVGAVFVVRQGVGVGWKGFVRGAGGGPIEALAVPFDHPSMLAEVYNRRSGYLGHPMHGSEIEARMWSMLGVPAPADLLIIPVALFDELVCLLYAQSSEAGALKRAHASDLSKLGAAMSASFERLTRAAQR